jgi:GDP-4-dehydro-6-deoxy-D-mannose reductase
MRPFNHSGTGQDERLILPTFAAQIARIEAGFEKPRLIVGDLSVERAFLHILDVVDAYLAILRIAGSVVLSAFQRYVWNTLEDRGSP